MLPHNRQALEAIRPDYVNWTVNKCLNQFNWQEVQRVIREEWDPGYTVDYWCGHCLTEMLKFAFGKMDAETEVIKIKL